MHGCSVSTTRSERPCRTAVPQPVVRTDQDSDEINQFHVSLAANSPSDRVLSNSVVLFCFHCIDHWRIMSFLSCFLQVYSLDSTNRRRTTTSFRLRFTTVCRTVRQGRFGRSHATYRRSSLYLYFCSLGSATHSPIRFVN